MERVIVVAFDAINRAGKGTQATLLQQQLEQQRIPSVILRGDGSRDGLGIVPGDPFDREWQSFHPRLKLATTPEERYQLWQLAAEKLADEFLHWRHEVMSARAKESSGEAVIILDRSLLSRMAIMIDMERYCDMGSLYRDRDRWKMLLPDVLFYLDVPPQALIDRLDKADPKYDFRRNLIENHHQFYGQAIDLTPVQLRQRIVRLDGTQSVDEINEKVWGQLAQYGLAP